MLKQANKELRKAQKDMYAGETDKSIADLEKIQDLIVENQRTSSRAGDLMQGN